MEPVAGLTVGALKSFPFICSDNQEFSKNILKKYRNISRNPGFISRILNKKNDFKFGILDLEYLVFYPWVIMEERKFNSKEFLFCPVSFEPKIRVENYFLPNKSSERFSIEQPTQKGVFQYQIPISTSGIEIGFLEICPGMSGIFRKYLLSKPLSLINYLNVKSGLPEMPVTFYKQSNIFHESEKINYERNTSLIGHLLSFSYDTTITEIKKGFAGNKLSWVSPDTLHVLNKWMNPTIGRVKIPNHGSGIPNNQIFNQEGILHPNIRLKNGQLLNQGPFTGYLKNDDRKQSLNFLSPFSDLQSSFANSYHSSDSIKTRIQHKSEGLLDRKKRSYPEMRVKTDFSMDKKTVTGDISSEVLKQREYALSPSLTAISNPSLPDNYPNKEEKNEIDHYSTMILKKEKERYEKGNILNELRQAGQIRKTTINLISDPLAVNYGVLNKSDSVFSREPMNTGTGKFDKLLSYHLISRSGFQKNSITINPVHSSNRVTKSGNHMPGTPTVYGEVPLSTSILPFEDRKSNQQSRLSLIDQQTEDDFISRTQRTHPVQMEFVHMKENIPQEITQKKKDVVEEERSSSLSARSTNQMHLDIHHLTEQVYQMLEKKIQIERERRGM